MNTEKKENFWVKLKNAFSAGKSKNSSSMPKDFQKETLSPLEKSIIALPQSFDLPYDLQDKWMEENKIPNRNEAIAAKILFLANDFNHPHEQKETLALNFTGSMKPINLKTEQKEIVKTLDRWTNYAETSSKIDDKKTAFWSSLKDQIKDLNFTLEDKKSVKKEFKELQKEIKNAEKAEKKAEKEAVKAKKTKSAGIER